jgi:hypothetical protein
MSKITGGCLCGSVRYTSEAEPALVAVCHCATCQLMMLEVLTTLLLLITAARQP